MANRFVTLSANGNKFCLFLFTLFFFNIICLCIVFEGGFLFVFWGVGVFFVLFCFLRSYCIFNLSGLSCGSFEACVCACGSWNLLAVFHFQHAAEWRLGSFVFTVMSCCLIVSLFFFWIVLALYFPFPLVGHWLID